MSTLLDSYFDIEGMRYDIVKHSDYQVCSVIRDDVVIFKGCLTDCRIFTFTFITSLNELHRP